MTASDALADGRLTDAVGLQFDVVRAAPAAAAPRLFLAELLALAGRFREAYAELGAVESADPGWPRARRNFRTLVRLGHRRDNGGKPAFMGDIPLHARRRRKAYRDPDPAAAARWADRADEAAPHVLGHVDGREFDGLRDADDRFASVLEVFAAGAYVWVPWEHLRRLTIRPAEHPLDAAFRPARVRLADGTEFDGHLPLIYPGSAAADDAFAFGLETDLAGDGGPVRGLGAKLWFAGEEELAPGDCRQFDFRAWA